MDSEKGGLVSSGSGMNAAQRQTASDIARKKVLAAYGDTAQTAASAQNNTAALSAASANGERQGAQAKGTHMKDQPAMTRINSESWKKYHSAWQNYYQKYYSEYYSQAARNYVEKERLKDARKKAEEDDTLDYLARTGVGANKVGAIKRAEKSPLTSGDEIDNIGARLKQSIRKKAVKNVKKSRRRLRWVPFLAGVAVVLLILFLQYNRLIFAPIFAYVSPGNAPATSIEAIDPTVTQTVSADPRLIIPKLNVDVPIHFGLQLSEVMSAMNNGVAHYRIAGASAYPGEIGNTVITGHSAGDVYSSNPYKYIFSGLERLEEGDLIYVNYESVRYTYQVTGKKVVEPTDVKALVVETDVPMLTLVTCTPLGTSRYRLLVFADQISPSYDGAEEPEDTVIDVESDDDSSMPSNEATFFEGIWNFLTGGN